MSKIEYQVIKLLFLTAKTAHNLEFKIARKKCLFDIHLNLKFAI